MQVEPIIFPFLLSVGEIFTPHPVPVTQQEVRGNLSIPNRRSNPFSICQKLKYVQKIKLGFIAYGIKCIIIYIKAPFSFALLGDEGCVCAECFRLVLPTLLFNPMQCALCWKPYQSCSKLDIF